MRGKAMMQIKNQKQRIISGNKETIKTKKKNHLAKIPFDIRGMLLLRSQHLFALGFRLALCYGSLQSYNDMPDTIETNSILHDLGTVSKNELANNTNSAFELLNIKSDKECADIVLEALECKIYEQKSFRTLVYACFALSCLYDSLYPAIQEDEMDTFCRAEDILTRRSHEAIGYWTAKLEEKRRNMNGGAKAKKEKGRKNREAIEKVMDDLGISSLNIFRINKELRDKFYAFAKKETDMLSPKRIYDLANIIQKEKSNTLDTKPPI
jgi:hypothetical protein